MAKIKYYYDKKTLSYKRIKLSGVNKIKRILYFLSISIISGLIMLFIFFNFFDSPKEIMLKRELSYTIEQYELLNSQLNQVELVLDDLQRRDDNIYRVIFEAEPIASSIRKAGFGGVNRYKHLEGMKNTELVLNTTKKIIVVTHYLPSIKCINKKYENDKYNDLYYTDCQDLFYNVDYWICGHSHCPFDKMINNTHIILNPRGTPDENTNYSKTLVINTSKSNL